MRGIGRETTLTLSSSSILVSLPPAGLSAASFSCREQSHHYLRLHDLILFFLWSLEPKQARESPGGTRTQPEAPDVNSSHSVGKHLYLSHYSEQTVNSGTVGGRGVPCVFAESCASACSGRRRPSASGTDSASWKTAGSLRGLSMRK